MELLSLEHKITERPMMLFQPFGRTPDGKRIDDVSGVSMRGHIACLEEILTRKTGQQPAKQAARELSRLLNERIRDSSYHVTPEFLKNPWNSYSHEFAVFLPCFCAMLAEDPDFHIKAGRRLVQPMIQTLGRPFSVQQIFKMITYFGSKYAKAIQFEAIQLENTHATIRITYAATSLRQFGEYQRGCVSDICETIKAGLATVPQAVHGLRLATVRDRACVAKGDPWCEYGITWESEERNRLVWVTATVGIVVLTFLVSQLLDPLASMTESVLLSLLSAVVLEQLHRRAVLRRNLRRQSEIIDEQARTTDARHEQLREAYLEQEQRTADLQRRLNELTLLHQTGILLTSSRDPGELISSALRTLIKGLNFDRGLLCFFDAHGLAIKDVWTIGADEEVVHPSCGSAVSICDARSVEGIVLLRGQPLLVKNATEIPAETELVRRFATRSFIAVPLKVKDRVLGLVLVGRLSHIPVTESDLELMVTFANQLAVGIDNARAYREIEELNVGLESKVRQRTAELEAVNARLKELDNLKSQFLAHVSHELRTPLTSIQGFADNMLAEFGGPLTEKQRQNLQRITANTGRLHRMIANLLNQAQIEAGKIELSLRNVQLQQLVEDVIEHMRPMAQIKQQTFELHCPEPPLIVWGDPDRLRQVITNLIDNAIKYSPLHGHIQIAITQVNGEMAKLSVIDSGNGIPRDVLPRVFEAFYRGKADVGRDSKGFGLGLSIVKTLVELHSGQVSVDSELGTGTFFHVTLPTCQKLSREHEEVSLNMQRILIADDDPDIRQFLIDRLEGAGYTVKAASTGREAITAVSVEKFDGAILDIGLPDLNGVEVLQNFRSNNLKLPVLMITAAEARERAMRAVESGANAFLLKPFDSIQFERAVLQCFGKSESEICEPSR